MTEVFSAAEGRNQFLEMFVAQVQHQDPLSPMDQTEILGQLAQFSQVESLETLNQNFESLLQSEQQAQTAQLASTGAALVGREIGFGESGSGVVQSVQQDAGTVLVDIGGTTIPLTDITSVSQVSADENAE